MAVTDFGASAQHRTLRADTDKRALDSAIAALETSGLAARPDVAEALSLLKGEVAEPLFQGSLAQASVGTPHMGVPAIQWGGSASPRSEGAE